MGSTRHKIVATIYDGRTIAYGTTTIVVAVAGDYNITITISRHRDTERVLEYKFTTDPACDPGTPVNETIAGNQISVTIVGVGAGTTLTVEATASGF